MIASVVVSLNDRAGRRQDTLNEIRSSNQIELGGYTHECRRIPLTIDSPNREDIEAVTRWLQDRQGVLSVDVIFVHFEDSDENSSDRSDTSSTVSREFPST